MDSPRGALLCGFFVFFGRNFASELLLYYQDKERRPPDGVRLGARWGQLLAKKTRRTVHKDRARPAWGPGCGFCVLGGWPCGVARNPGQGPGLTFPRGRRMVAAHGGPGRAGRAKS